jgi:hypothetical protein
MDAQPKPNRRLVPGHLTAAEHVITSVSGDKPGTSWAVFIGASGGCQRLFALVAPGEGTPSGRHPRHSEAADQCAPPCRLHLLSTMPNTRGNRTKRGGIQSIDRAARILNALPSGARRLGVSELAQKARARPGNRPWPVAGAPGSRLRRAGSQLGQIPARRRPAATRHLLPRPQRASRSLAGARRAARRPSRCRRARRCYATARA